MNIKESINTLFEKQIKEWPQAANNYALLTKVEVRDVVVDGVRARIQYNPARILSTSSKIDTKSIKERHCFLCSDYRPSKQRGVDFISKQGNKYIFLVNPFPIFNRHFTVPSVDHLAQSLENRFSDMVEIVSEIGNDYLIFFNGAKSGASAPDHFHFQLGERGFLPIEQQLDSVDAHTLADTDTLRIKIYKKFFKGTYSITSDSESELCEAYNTIMQNIANSNTDKVNVIMWKDDIKYTCLIIQRNAHRPSCYSAEGLDRLLISPGSVDLGGVFILPLKPDFDRITHTDLEAVVSEVCIDDQKVQSQVDQMRQLFHRKQQSVNVGLMCNTFVRINFNDGDYYIGWEKCESFEVFRFRNDKIEWRGLSFNTIEINAGSRFSTFEVENVPIGVDFHWQRTKNLRYKGNVVLSPRKGTIEVVNDIGIEDYLLSVISSEMRNSAPLEFLKAHAIISRSWLMYILENRSESIGGKCHIAPKPTDDRYVMWYDHEDHDYFDVCADDHCQRYQGVQENTSKELEEVIFSTWGEVLSFEDKICDARFSKCCGGLTERYSSCWEDRDYPYLTPIVDSNVEYEIGLIKSASLADEITFIKWVTGRPHSFCNIKESELLSSFLNNYDCETTQFFRWKHRVTAEQLSKLLLQKLGLDFGLVLELNPILRAPSGRLIELEIVGEKRRLIVGKELEIRRVLSDSHLLSSAFYVQKEGDEFIFHGAGWGHGVGLCQIGAAMMGQSGYTSSQILAHYYQGTKVIKVY